MASLPQPTQQPTATITPTSSTATTCHTRILVVAPSNEAADVVLRALTVNMRSAPLLRCDAAATPATTTAALLRGNSSALPSPPFLPFAKWASLLQPLDGTSGISNCGSSGSSSGGGSILSFNLPTRGSDSLAQSLWEYACMETDSYGSRFSLPTSFQLGECGLGVGCLIESMRAWKESMRAWMDYSQ